MVWFGLLPPHVSISRKPTDRLASSQIIDWGGRGGGKEGVPEIGNMMREQQSYIGFTLIYVSKLCLIKQKFERTVTSCALKGSYHKMLFSFQTSLSGPSVNRLKKLYILFRFNKIPVKLIQI